MSDDFGLVDLIGLIIIIGISISIFIFLGNKVDYNYQNIDNTQQQCQHEFVTTSQYSIFSRSGYKIVSKCTKCGYVVE